MFDIEFCSAMWQIALAPFINGLMENEYFDRIDMLCMGGEL
jgi:hypothetical protein